MPYRSGATALPDLLAGQTQMQFVKLPPALQHVRAGRVKARGVTSLTRAASLPEVPPIAETGVPGFEDQQWQGVLGSAHLPRAIVNKLNGALVSVMAQQEVRARLTGMGAEVLASSPEWLTQFINAQVGRWSQVITPAMRVE